MPNYKSSQKNIASLKMHLSCEQTSVTHTQQDSNQQLDAVNCAGHTFGLPVLEQHGRLQIC